MRKLLVRDPDMEGGKGRLEGLADRDVGELWVKELNQGAMKLALDGSRLYMAVLGYSKAEPCGMLNAQVITLLLERGVSFNVLLALDQQYKTSVMYMTINIWNAIDYLFIRGRHCELQRLLEALRKPPEIREEPMRRIWEDLKSLQASEISRWSKSESYVRTELPSGGLGNVPLSLHDHGDDFLAKFESMGARDRMRRVFLPLYDSRRLYGVADSCGLLKAGECFVRVSTAGNFKTVTGPVCVVRNPCYHPGDLVILNAVPCEALNGLMDVIVFSTEGLRPAADMCSGGDLDGDTFLVIWDGRIMSELVECEAFDYRPDVLKAGIQATALRLGIKAQEGRYKEPAPRNKTNLIARLTSKTSNDALIGQVDSLFVELRKFEFQEESALHPALTPRTQLTRDELTNILNALFSAGVDDMDLDVESLIKAIQKQIVNGRTSSSSEIDLLLHECIRMSNNVIEFQARQKKYVMSIWNFFMMSWDEDKTWEDAEFMVTFRPPEARENIDLAVKVMRLAERLITDSPMVNGILDEGVLETFNRFLSIETVVECSKAVAVAEAELKNVIDEMQENHAFHAMIRYKQILLEKAAVEEVLTELYEPEEVWAETEKLEELKNEERKLKEKMTEGLAAVEDLKKVKGRWEKMKERHAALSDVIKKCRDVLEGKIRPLDPQLIVDTGVILHMELWMFQSGLPIYESRTKLMQFMSESQVALVLSATGSGKSTCIPHFIANELFFQGRLTPSKPIIVAQPRRQATLSLAERLAQSRDTMLGQAVGSHIGRSRARVNKDKTIINCTTYGILLHYARMDPMFMNYSVIILDEVHEDSPELYFLFSIVRKALKVNRELKVILMSAMVDSDKISGFFEKCDVIEVSGRSHPIEEFYEGSLSTDEMTYTSLAIEKALELHTTTPMDDNPDILVFLPLSKPIEDCAALFSERARQKIGDAARNIFAFGLHSGVPDEDKRFILKRGRIEEWGEIQRRAAAAEEGDSDVEGGVKDVFGDKGIWAGEGNSLNDTLSRIINDVSNPTRKPRDVISTIDLVDEDDATQSNFQNHQRKAPFSRRPSAATHLSPTRNGPISSSAPFSSPKRSVLSNPLVRVDGGVINLDSDSDTEVVRKPMTDLMKIDGVILLDSDDEKSVDGKATTSIEDSLDVGMNSGKAVAGADESQGHKQITDDDDDLEMIIIKEVIQIPEDDLSDTSTPIKPPSPKKNRKQKRKERDDERVRRREELKRLEQERKKALRYDGTRRVIFCTNIAETSLTFPRIGYVIDTGLRFSVTYMPIMNVQRTSILSTTKVSALQRKGRAGRLGPGKCYRLYSFEEGESFPEQIFSNPEQLDYMLLGIIDMYETVDGFDWFTRPSDEEISWTLGVLEDCGFIEAHDNRHTVTPDGKIAMDLGRYNVRAQTARFLLDVWRCKATTPKLKEHCTIIAAFHAVNVTRSFKPAFSYTKTMQGVTEEIGCPPELLSLPATICKLNVYWMWRRLETGRRRRMFCRTFYVRNGDFEEVQKCAEDVMGYMRRRVVEVPSVEWFFDAKDWNQVAWDEYGEGDGGGLSPKAEVDDVEDYYLIDSGDEMNLDEIWIDDVKISYREEKKDKKGMQKSHTNDFIGSSLFDPVDAAKMGNLQQIAFILDHLTKSFFTNLAYLDGIRENARTGQKLCDAQVLIHGDVLMGRLDRKEMTQFDHAEFRGAVFLFSGIASPKENVFYLSHLDRVPPNRYPMGFPRKYVEAYGKFAIHDGKEYRPKVGNEVYEVQREDEGVSEVAWMEKGELEEVVDVDDYDSEVEVIFD